MADLQVMPQFMKFSLLTFNTLGTPIFADLITARYKTVAEIIKNQDLDIVCLQEIQTYYHLFLFKKYLKEYPYVMYQKFLYGPKGGLVIFSKFPLENRRYREFSALGEFRNISFYSKFLRNGILLCDIKNTNLTIATTHLTCDYFFDWAPENHLYKHVEQQIKDVIHEVQTVTKAGNSLILSGDFNSKKDGRLYKKLLEQTKLTDAFKDMETPTYSPNRVHYTFKAPLAARIDHLFYHKGNAQLKMLSYGQIFDKKVQLLNGQQSYLSDHIGLKVEFDLV